MELVGKSKESCTIVWLKATLKVAFTLCSISCLYKERIWKEIRTHLIFLPVSKHVIYIALNSKCHIWLNFRKNLWQIMHKWRNREDKTRSMVDLQSALSKNWSVDEKKLPNPTMGKITGQSTGSNKMNCHIRLTTRALARGATFIKICRNR